MDSTSLSFSLSLPLLERNPRTDNSLNRTMRFLDTYPRASFFFPLSFLHFLFFLRSLSPPSFPPPNAVCTRYTTGHRSLLTRDRTHTPLSHPHSSPNGRSLWKREGGRETVHIIGSSPQLGPVGTGCSASKDSSPALPLPPGPKGKEIRAS